MEKIIKDSMRNGGIAAAFGLIITFLSADASGGLLSVILVSVVIGLYYFTGIFFISIIIYYLLGLIKNKNKDISKG